MIELLLANFLALFHGLIVIPIMTITPFALWSSKRNFRLLENTYALFAIVTVVTYLATGECFLSRWEELLRTKTDPTAIYGEGFVRYYLGKVNINWPEEWTLYSGSALIILGLTGFYYKRLREKSTRR